MTQPDLRHQGAHRIRTARVTDKEGCSLESKGRTFRDLIKDEPYVFTGGVYSPLDAQIAERVGMKAIYLSGYSMALANGWPDMGFLTMTEMTRIASMVASAVDIPIIADADDGYGNALAPCGQCRSSSRPASPASTSKTSGSPSAVATSPARRL